MSSQPPSDPSGQQMSSTPNGPPGTFAQPFEYIPTDAPQSAYAPMQQPAYLYPYRQPYAPVPAPAQDKWPTRGLALAGFILGLSSILLWIVPCLGYAVSVVGMALSILGWRAPTRKWMAMAGLALSLATLTLSFYNSTLGGYIFPH